MTPPKTNQKERKSNLTHPKHLLINVDESKKRENKKDLE